MFCLKKAYLREVDHEVEDVHADQRDVLVAHLHVPGEGSESLSLLGALELQLLPSEPLSSPLHHAVYLGLHPALPVFIGLLVLGHHHQPLEQVPVPLDHGIYIVTPHRLGRAQVLQLPLPPLLL